MPATKLDLYKLHKEEYVTPASPTLVKIKAARYLAVPGQGAPGGEVFSACVGALYAVAYTIKMDKKAGGNDYKVSGLEGQWWGTRGNPDFLSDPRETWCWKLLIRVPDFVSKQDVQAAAAAVKAKRKSEEADTVQLEKITEGLCLQMLHVGPYDTEMNTMARMRACAREQGLEFRGLHHELYLSDPHRVAPEKVKTIIRLPVRRK